MSLITMRDEIQKELRAREAESVYFVDISALSYKETRGFRYAILICVLLPKDYLNQILINGKEKNLSEFSKREHYTDGLAEWTSEYLTSKGYHAFAQSESNLLQDDSFDCTTKSSLLPHKTIAGIAGLGWIGKNNLFITNDYGCAFCMCSVLTDAPFETKKNLMVESKCGNCMACTEICPTGAIHGYEWTKKQGRDRLIDVFKCDGCLKCLACCPWTKKYSKVKSE